MQEIRIEWQCGKLSATYGEEPVDFGQAHWMHGWGSVAHELGDAQIPVDPAPEYVLTLGEAETGLSVIATVLEAIGITDDPWLNCEISELPATVHALDPGLALRLTHGTPPPEHAWLRALDTDGNTTEHAITATDTDGIQRDPEPDDWVSMERLYEWLWQSATHRGTWPIRLQDVDGVAELQTWETAPLRGCDYPGPARFWPTEEPDDDWGDEE